MILRPRGRADVRGKGIGAKKALVAKSPENVKNGQFYKRSYEGGIDHVTIVKMKQDSARKALVPKSPESVQNGQFYKRSHECGFDHVKIMIIESNLKFRVLSH